MSTKQWIARARWAVALLICASCEVENQKPQEAFVDGIAPAELLRLANPEPPDDVQRAAVKKCDEKLRVRVAVIDQGVDYLHPDLAHRVAYTVQDGRLVGAGRDILADDDWAHPNLIDPALYALGARAVVQGKIEGPHPDPVQLLMELNETFMTKLTTGLAAHPQLADSLFARVDTSAFSVWGAYYLTELWPTFLEEHQAAREEERLIGTDPEANARVLARAPYEERLMLRCALRLPWRASLTRGVPQLCGAAETQGKVLAQIEHADLFLSLVRDALAAFEAETDYPQLVAPFISYQEARSDDYDLEDTLVHLNQAWHRTQMPGAEADPYLEVADIFCSMLDLETYEALRSPVAQDGQKSLRVKELVDGMLDQMDALDRLVVSSDPEDFTDVQRERAREHLDKSDELRTMVHDYVETRGVEPLLCSDNDHRSAPEAYQAWGRATLYPLLSEVGRRETHGTHVAGIVARQDPRIAIVPVRVMTSRVRIASMDQTHLNERSMERLRRWLEDPVVLHAVGQLVRPLLASSEANATDEPTLAQVGDWLTHRASKTNEMPAMLAFGFTEDLLQAADYVRDQKVLVANASLSIDFQQPKVSGEESTDQDSVFRFIVGEYVKYELARALRDRAPNTLFVVAAGNSGEVINGEEKSAVPCDLSSPFLSRSLEAFPGRSLPNQEVENLLCVTSIDSEGQLSEFSNIVKTGVPLVASYGENIVSAIRSYNCTGADAAFEETYGFGPVYVELKPDSERNRRLVTALEAERSGGESELGVAALEERMGFYSSLTQRLVPTLTRGIRAHDCVMGRYVRAPLSGTSMATPAVAGYVARWALGMMEERDLDEENAYGHPDLLPARIIEHIALESPPYEGTNGIEGMPQVINVELTEVSRGLGTSTTFILSLNGSEPSFR